MAFRKQPPPPLGSLDHAPLGNLDKAPIASLPKQRVASHFTPVQSLNIRAIQQELVRRGYKINVTGQLDPLTKSALKDFLQPSAQHPLSEPLQNALGGTGMTQLHRGTTSFDTGGARDPQAWNKAHGFGTTLTPSTVAANHADHSLRRGTNVGQTNEPPPVNGPGSTPRSTQSAGSGGTVPYGTLSSLATATGKQIPMSLADFGNMIDPKTAQAIANAQYGPQIAAAQLQLQLDPGQFAQDIKDITSWYGQVGAAQKAAQTAVAGMGTAGTGSMSDAAGALAASLGGSANMGAHDVAASGQNAVDTQAALAQAANTYEANMGPLLAAEGAEQKVNQQNKNATQLLTDKEALAALQSASGSAAQAALAQIQGSNNSLAQARASMAAQILGNNNALSQQDFSNELALMNSIASAQSLGLKTEYTQQQINNLASEIQGRTAKNNQGAMAVNHPFAYYQQHDPKYLTQTATDAAGALKDRTGLWVQMTPQQAWQRVTDVYRAAGFQPVPGTPSYAAAQNVVNLWQSGLGS